jgi:hypothetical protein
MKKILILLAVVCGVLLIPIHARTKRTTSTEAGYQVATVVSVKKHVSASNYAGDNPSDAPLQARDYSYDIGIRLNCNVYVGRYESAIRYLPSVFSLDHHVDVRLRKHVMFVSLPFNDEEVMMGIVGHRRVKDEVCAGTSSKTTAGQVSNHFLTQNKFKGGLV